jgi:hypothetical protein
MAVYGLARTSMALASSYGLTRSKLSTGGREAGAGRNEMADIKILKEEKQAAEERIEALENTLRDADHLCRWLLQSDISPADRERVIRENGINFAAALAPPNVADRIQGVDCWMCEEKIEHTHTAISPQAPAGKE